MLDLYGVGDPVTDDYGRRCLLARRLVEKGVRVVVRGLAAGRRSRSGTRTTDIEENHLRMAAQTDKPIAGLLKDLKQRGLLDSTLVVWGGEFGRTPEAENGKGRDHNNTGFTMWMAGGGVRGGIATGATDEIGLRAVEDPHHLRDIHTTVLHQLGLEPGCAQLPPPGPKRAADRGSRRSDQSDRLERHGILLNRSEDRFRQHRVHTFYAIHHLRDVQIRGGAG